MRLFNAFVLIVCCVPPVAAQVPGSRDAFVATQDPLGEPVSKVVYLRRTGHLRRACDFTSPSRDRRSSRTIGFWRSSKSTSRNHFVTTRTFSSIAICLRTPTS